MLTVTIGIICFCLNLLLAYFVFTKVSYRHVPLFGLAGTFGTMDFERTFAVRPRKGSEIAWK